jgi:hypothetical protein
MRATLATVRNPRVQTFPEQMLREATRKGCSPCQDRWLAVLEALSRRT